MGTPTGMRPADGARGELRRAAVATGLAVAAVLVAMPGIGPGAAAFGSAVLLAMATLACEALPAGHPHDRLGLANRATLARGGGVAVLAALAVAPQAPGAAACWAALAGTAGLLALDGFDGWVARRQRLASAFGARFDMEVDAALILVLSVLALRSGAAGAWVLALGLMRYGFVAAGMIWPALRAELPPSLRRKAVCVAQVAVLAALLAPPLGPPLSEWLAGAALAALAASFAADIRWLVRAR